MRYHLRATVNQRHLYKVPEVWFHAGNASVGSRRGQNGMSAVPFVSAARLRVEISWQEHRLDATDRVRRYCRSFVLSAIYTPNLDKQKVT